jgi:hypothetical protein
VFRRKCFALSATEITLSQTPTPLTFVRLVQVLNRGSMAWDYAFE